MAYNGVQIENSPNIIVITDSDANQITVTQPITRTVEVSALGPQGPKGDSVPFIQIGTTNTWYTTSDIEITGSLTVSGSNTFKNIGTGIFSGSLVITGSALYNGNELLTTAITGGYVTTASFNAFSASYAVDSASFDTRILINSSSITILSGSFLTLSGSFLVASASFDSRINLLSASFQSLSSSYVTTSGSVSTRLSSLEQFSSSLDATFATDAQLNAATASLSSSIAALSSSYLVSSASFDTRINSIASGSEQLSGSLAGYTTTSSFNSFTSSYKTDSASFDTRILSNSSSIALLSGSFLITSSSFQSRITSNSASIAALSGSYLSDSSSFAQRITSTSGSLAILSGSFQSFSGSYNTGSFTGSFTGQGTFNNLNATTATITGNVTVLGTASINTLIVNQTQLSTGSNQLGDAADDTQTLYGTVRIPTGSLTVTGSSFFTGSLNLGTGTVLYGDTTTPSLVLDQTTGAYLKYGTTSEVTVQGSTAILKASNTVQLRTGTTTHLFVTSSGYVGIGTLAPTSKLQIAVGSVLIDNNFSYRQKTSIGGNIGLIYIDNSDLMGIYEGKINVTSGGNVGIGTTSPQARLHISSSTTSAPTLLVGRASGQSSIKASSDATGLYLSLDSNGSATLINHYVTDNVWLASGGGSVAVGHNNPTARLHVKGAGSTNSTYGLLVRNSNDSSSLVVLDNGNVGIGTTAPLRQLHVVGDIEVSNGIYGDATDHTFYTIASSSFHHRFYTRTSGGTSLERFTIQGGADSGSVLFQNTNVGIGTTAPTSQLDIRTTSQAVAALTAGYGSNPNLTVGTSTIYTTYQIANGNIDHIFFTRGTSGTTAERLRIKGGAAITDLQVTSSNFIVETNALYVSASGLVGIGTSTPGEKLEVAGNIKLSDGTQRNIIGALNNSLGIYASPNSTAEGIIFSTDNGTTAEMFIQDGGNVGIGTTTPTERLQVSGSVSIKPSGTTDTLLFTNLGSTQSRLMSNSNFAIWNSGSETMRLLTTGNVGIGNSSPTARLQVKGSGTTSGTTSLLVQNANASASLVVLDDGDVGIGTTTPNARLDVSGSAIVTGSITTTGNITTTGGNLTVSNGNISIAGALTQTGGYPSSATLHSVSSNFSSTSGVSYGKRDQVSFNPTSGTSAYIGLAVNTTINQTGGANGITRGLFISPTLTSAADFRAIEINSGSIILADNYVASGSRSGSILDISQTWNVSGSGVVTGIKYNVTNISSSVNSSLLDLQVGGASQFKITAGPAPGPVARNGYVFGGNGVSAISPVDPTTTFFSSTGTAIRISDANSGAGYSYHIYSAQYTDKTYTSGVGGFVSVTRGFAPTSGTGVFNVMVLENTINQTGGANGITRGLFISPTLTAAADFRAIQNTVGSNLLNSTSGNTYIGLSTNTGTARLQVRGSGTTNATTAFRVENANTSGSMVVLDDGNVGIGTNTPDRLVHISSSVGNALRIDNVGSGQNAIFIGNISSLIRWSNGSYFSNTGMYSGGDDQGYLTFDGANVQTRLSIKADTGNIGIGTTTQTSRLQVKGSGATSATTAFRVENANASGSMVILDNGNVGIGTTTPAFKFDALGSATSGVSIVGQFIGGTGTSAGGLKLGAYSAVYGGFWSANVTPTTSNYALISSGADTGLNSTLAINFYINDSSRATVTSTGLGIGITTPTSRLHVKGSGTTSATTALRVENSSASPSLTITDDLNSRFFGNVGVGTTPSASLHVFGTTLLSGSAGTGSALTVYKSGSTVMSIQGSQGELFSITDSLSGSLFSVSNISGLPILEVFSDNTVLLGSYLDPMLITTQRVTANSGSTVIYSLPTASYDGVFVDYVIRSGSNARAGQFMGMWSGSLTNFTDNSTTDFGDTTGFIFGLVVSGSNMVLTGSASTSAWTVRAGIRSI